MRILKFGGKSLATPEKMQNICKNIKKIYKKDKKIIVVVSAIGKTTDNLISLADEFCKENSIFASYQTNAYGRRKYIGKECEGK